MQITICSPNEIFRLGVSSAIRQKIPQVIINEFSNLEEVQSLGFCIIIDLDGKKPAYLAVIENLLSKSKHTRLMLFSAELDQNLVNQIRKLEASAFLLKDVKIEEFFRALDSLSADEKYFDQRIFEYLIKEKKSKDKASTTITPQQKRILELISQEYTNKEIAEKLNISHRTVDGHRYRLIKRFGVKNTAGLIRYAIDAGIIKK